MDAGESWEETARREVLEETGVESRITGPAAPIAYALADDTPKVVVFFPMAVVSSPTELQGDPDEVDEAVWWPLDRARRELTYADERRVVSQLAPG